MNDALISIGNIKQLNTGFVSRVSGCDDKIPATGHQRIVATPRQGIDNMVHRAERMLTSAHRALFLKQAVQGHATGSLVQKNTIDIQQGLTL